MTIMNAEISSCRLYKSEGWYWWEIQILFENGIGTHVVKCISDGNISNVVSPSVAMMLKIMDVTDSYCLDEIQGNMCGRSWTIQKELVR